MPLYDAGGRTVAYDIVTRPRRRHAAIQIDRAGAVHVLVPPGYRRDDVPALLERHRAWLLRHVDRDPVRPHSFQAGDRFCFLGTPFVLRSGGGLTERPSLLPPSDGVAVVAAALAPEEVRGVLVEWYRRQAEEVLADRIRTWGPRVGQSPSRMKVHEYRSRWGYCRGDGLIAFNWRIVQAPLVVVDYVVVHELAHLRHPHHQPPFWTEVARHHPDHPVFRRWLSEHGRELYW